MNDIYSLRIYDTELVRFSMEKRGLEGLVAKVLSVQKDKSHLMPLNLEVTDKGIVHWLEHRVIPKNRAFVDEILKTLGLGRNDTKGIIDVCKGLSLNDSYWVVPEGFEGPFSEYNLYQNRFSEMLALVAYTGAGRSKEAFTTSPELTTNGALPKAWRLLDGEIWLYKGGTSGASNTGREPYCEFYAAQIAETMGLNVVPYGLENWKGITASRCPLFTNIDTSFVPAGQLVKSGGIKDCLDHYKSLGPEFEEQLRSMLVFDALVYNEDRHFGNFGLLRDNHSGRITTPAPLFDHGQSLLFFASKDELENLECLKDYAKLRSNPYNVSYEEICVEVMGPTQRVQLRRMIGFRFKRHPSLNLSETHLTLLERLLEERVRELLKIPIRQRGRKHSSRDER